MLINITPNNISSDITNFLFIKICLSIMGTVRFVACFDMVGWQTGIWLYAVIQIELVWLFIMPIKFAVFLEFLQIWFSWVQNFELR